MSKLAAVLLAVAVAFAGPVLAQDQNPAITLRVDAGTVLTSTGGDFSSATTGKPLAVGEKVMVNENSRSAAVYGSDCDIKFDKPGVYGVPSECKRGAWVTDADSKVNTWMILGGAAIAAALLIGDGGGDNPPPLSTGAR